MERRHRVTVVGSGNWGSTIAKIIAENTVQHSDLFEPEVRMWVYEEDVTIARDSVHYDPARSDQQKLSEVVNRYHENVKYLPGIVLPRNLVAVPDLRQAVKDSSVLVFNMPHQFIGKLCHEMRGHILPFARAISCIKGVDLKDGNISFFSESIGAELDIYCGSLSGANIANEIAAEKWSETTIAYDPPSVDLSQGSAQPAPVGAAITNAIDCTSAQSKNEIIKTALSSTADNTQSFPTTITMPPIPPQQPQSHEDDHAQAEKSSTRLTPVPVDYPPLGHEAFRKLFHRPYFHVQMVSDVQGVSLCGALKNIVALAAGFVDGRGWGDNAKAAIMRVGLLEMVRFGKEFFGRTVRTDTFTECSAGVADIITSCSGGRNFRCAKMAVQRGLTVAEIEKAELNGQMLQGISTAIEVVSFLRAHGRSDGYPLFLAVHAILEGTCTVDDIPTLIAQSSRSCYL